MCREISLHRIELSPFQRQVFLEFEAALEDTAGRGIKSVSNVELFSCMIPSM